MLNTESDGYKRFRRGLMRILAMIILLPTIGVALWTWGALKFVYASGERSGYVQKISQKGWLCKTWEGELAMANLPGAMPQIFEFTVHDNQVAGAIEKSIGQRVSLHYEQHRYLPSNCFGDTEYFVTIVTSQGDSADMASPSSAKK